MSIYNYSAPKAPNYKKPSSVDACLPQARIMAKKEHGRTAMGPVKKGDKIDGATVVQVLLDEVDLDFGGSIIKLSNSAK